MIGFIEAIRNAFTQYASARGRASRAEYWWWVLFNAIIQLLLGDSALGGLAVLVLLLPSITVMVRRLHDLDRSAWFLLVALIPAVGLIILVVVLALPGTAASNRYGAPRMPDPTRSNAAGGSWATEGPGGAQGNGGPWSSSTWDAPPPPPPSR